MTEQSFDAAAWVDQAIAAGLRPRFHIDADGIRWFCWRVLTDCEATGPQPKPLIADAETCAVGLLLQTMGRGSRAVAA